MKKQCWWLLVVLMAIGSMPMVRSYAAEQVTAVDVLEPEPEEGLPEELDEGPVLTGYERAVAKDPAFANYVDLSLLGTALSEGDASLLVDVALSAAEGERVLHRSHASGLTSELLAMRAARLAGVNQDSDAIARLLAAGKSLNNTWVAQIEAVAKLSGQNRAIVDAVDISRLDDKSRNVVEMLEAAVQAAELTGLRDPLYAIEMAAQKADINADVKKMVASSVKATLESLPEPNAEVDDVLQQLDADSRGLKLPRLPKPPKLPLPCGFTGYKTDKFDLKAKVESGGWTVAWANDIAEKDVAAGVVAAGVSISTGNPAAFILWLDNLVSRTINSMVSSAKKKFKADIVAKAKRAAADAIRAAISGKSTKVVLKRYDTVDFKAGAIRYSGGNYLCGRKVSSTWGMKPYVAFRIR